MQTPGKSRGAAAFARATRERCRQLHRHEREVLLAHKMLCSSDNSLTFGRVAAIVLVRVAIGLHADLNPHVFCFMKNIEARLAELGISIPDIQPPLANYVPAKKSGNLVFTAGQVCALGDRIIKGKLGREIDIETGKEATRICAINCLAAIKQLLGSLNAVKEIIAVHGLINCVAEFTGQADVMNGASDFMVHVFGDQGKHTRTAVGVASLPHDFSASVYVIAEV